ncbi:Flagellar basal-body rod modification protein FlgD [Sulfitobacter noctilucicola]|uniref:Basal-body rod modification protein FlgD n=1 Tax=Sulfitobacter noctilucicola TaxID=1342301 RepID=A0A7W6M5D3_9RHOB|nr:flagellar hook capping FlgD N-terminal domain-containing protein [Sulfitobacter noctilucicola]KIN63006.1 Flagellar basal-body rod modification protein FlgD [Sulfitobacter noctilucicola]MBB4172467.1 flagellar basal-body rod modification protein FlgD [Sulfitobacter noctilucicola]
MEISPATAAATVSAASPQSNAPTQDASVLSSDFETFLKMLTAQARYQDPLEPIDSSEYAAQLAQFSMVEQQVLANDFLSSLSSQLAAGNLGQMANWIGMETRTTAPVLFDGSPIEISPNPAAVSDKVFLIVRDGTGQEVQRLRIPVSAEPISWAGVSSDGRPLDKGLFSFDVESWANGEIVLSEPAETYGRIVETRLQDGETVLILEGGSGLLATDVTGLREPASGI